MIGTILDVARGEGWPAVIRRARERLGESIRDHVLMARGVFHGPVRRAPPVLNVLAMRASPRLGGVPLQLLARLDVEQRMRTVALLEVGKGFARLRISAPSHIRRMQPHAATGALFDDSFAVLIRAALADVDANIVHFEGVAGVPLGTVLRLSESGIRIVLTIHDFSLFCVRPHLFEQPAGRFCDYSRDHIRCARCLAATSRAADLDERRALSAALLLRSTVIFPSRFMEEEHRRLFDVSGLDARVIEPGVAVRPIQRGPREAAEVPRIAFAGSVKRHKGGAAFLELVRRGIGVDADWRVFGGGDFELLRELRSAPRVGIHGYYRSGELPSLLVRDGIHIAVLPSVVPESFGLTLSECWVAGVPVVAFDHGALGQRIRDNGGGVVAPVELGADGLIDAIHRCLSTERSKSMPPVATTEDSARAHLAVYEQLWERNSISRDPAAKTREGDRLE